MIIEDDTKQMFKFIAWLMGIIVVLYFSSLLIFYKASSPERHQTRVLNQIVLQKSPITKIERNYHLDRGVNSYAVKGLSKNKKTYYFIYLPASKKAYLLPAKKGVSETSIKNKYSAKHPSDQLMEVNLGWYRNRAAWEVTGKDTAGDYRYQLYEFKNGNLLG